MLLGGRSKATNANSRYVKISNFGNSTTAEIASSTLLVVERMNDNVIRREMTNAGSAAGCACANPAYELPAINWDQSMPADFGFASSEASPVQMPSVLW